MPIKRIKNRFVRTVLFSTVCAYSLCSQGAAALANPEDGVVAAGSANFSQNGSKLDVYQHTDKAVIDWRTFNIGAGEHTQFHQPSSGSITVNRVRDMNPSQIDGKLSANGHVVLINQNGVMFGAGSEVDVGGLTTTSADIDNDDFMAGKMDFKHAGNANAKIVNAGRITARDAGLVTLVAPQVENSGVIEAKLGRVTMASAETMTLDMAGDGLVKVAVSSAQLQGHVKNSGAIVADGGRVVMSAGAARDIVDGLIVNTGSIRAKKGTVKLSAEGANKTAKSGSSKVVNAGTIDVSGTDAAADKGGKIEITGDDITLTSASVIAAAGNAGGGTINIGGDYLGAGIIPTSRSLRAESGSRTSADAVEGGDGGRVIYWSDDTTVFDGLITAKGGSLGGNGGFVETSGKINLGVNGIVDVSSLHSEGGQWLLDPSNVRIIRPGGTNVGGGTTNAPSDDFLINADSIQTALNGGSNVIITTNNGMGAQAGNLTVDASIAWTTANTLDLRAQGDLIINQAITGRILNLYAGSDIDINANIGTNLAGSGSLGLYNYLPWSTIGVGDGAAGMLHLSNEDLDYIQDGYASGGINIGSTNTTNVDMRTYSGWKDGFRINTHATGSVTINGAQNLNNNYATFSTGTLNVLAPITGLTTTTTGSHIFWTANNYNIQANVTGGTGSFNVPTFTPLTGGKSIGIGDGATCGSACDILFTNAMLDHFIGFSGLNFINTGGTNIDIRGRSWNTGITASVSAANTISVNGPLNMNGNRLQLGGGTVLINSAVTGYGATSYLSANDLDIAANMSGAGLSIYNYTSGTMGVGDGMAGTLHLSDAELNRITATGIAFGSETTTTLLNLGVRNWNHNFSMFTTSGGTANIDGAQTLNGNNFTVNAGTLNVNAPISGGSYNNTHTVLTVAQANIYAPITTSSGVFFHLRAPGSPVINADITASGTGFMVSGASKSLGVGDGSVGDVTISDAALDHLIGGIGFGGAPGAWDGNGWSTINVAARDWNNRSIRFSGDVVNINGNQNFGTGGMTIYASSLPNFVGDVASSGAFQFYNLRAGTPISLGLGNGTTGDVIFNDAYLDRLKSFGFSSYQFSSRSGIDIGYGNWNGGLSLFTSGGAVSTSGNINMNNNLLTMHGPTVNINNTINRGNANVAINANALNVSGSINGTNNIGTLVLNSYTAGQMGLGDGSSGVSFYSTALLNTLQSFGFRQFDIGDGSRQIDLRAMNWIISDVYMHGSLLRVNGAQNFNAAKVTLSSLGFEINNALTGTGAFEINTYSNAGTTLGLGSGTSGQTAHLDDTELGLISSTFSSHTFRASASNGGITVARNTTWNYSPTFILSGGGTSQLTVASAQNFGAHNPTFQTNNINVNAALSGTGTITFNTFSNNIGIGLGNGSSGGLNFDTNELNRINSGFTNVVFGSNSSANNTIDLRTHTWNNHVQFLTTGTGSINVNGIQNFGSRTATFGTNNLNIAQNVSGTGTLRIGNATATTMRVGDGGTGALHVDDAELARIQDGFANLIFGNDSTTTLDIRGSASWKDNVTFTAGTAVVNTAQNFGGNNATFRADEIDIAGNLSNGNQIQLTTRNSALGIEIGSTSAGLLNLTAAELNFIQNGWNNILIGGTDHEAAITVNEAVTFKDHTTFRNTSGATSDKSIDINAVITTTDDSDLNLYGYGHTSSAHGWSGVHIGADLNIARDLVVLSQPDFRTETNSIVAGRDIKITSQNNIRLDSSFAAGRDFIVTKPFTSTSHSTSLYTGRTINAAGNININTNSDFLMLGNSALRTDGNINITSIGIDFSGASSISGNTNGTSILTFLEHGENNNMEIGASSGTSWSMTDAELATIQNGFSKVVFGSASMTGDIIIDSWDISGKTFDVEIYGNDITLQDTDVTAGVDYGILTGSGSLLLHARDNAAIDPGTLTIGADIRKSAGGISLLDLRADKDIVFTSGADIVSTNGLYNVILNADRDADQDGAITLTTSSIATNGGYVVMGGGSGTVGGTNGILGDGDGTGADDVAAWGNATYDDGVTLNNGDITTGAGKIFIRGHGFNDSATSSHYGVNVTAGSILSTTTGAINIFGTGGNGDDTNYGINLSATSATGITSEKGVIYLEGRGGSNGLAGSNFNNGITLYNGFYITSTGTDPLDAATITMVGYGAAGEDSNRGIQLDANNNAASKITSNAGNISLSGYAGNSVLADRANNHGLALVNGMNIESTGLAEIYLFGQAGTNSTTSEGLFTSGATASSVGGTDADGKITLVSDTMNIASTTVQTSGAIHVRAQTGSTNINLGGPTGGLDLGDAELARLTAGKLIIGDSVSGTGNIVIDTWNMTGTNYDAEIYGGSVNVTGAGVTTMGSGDLLLRGRTQVVLNSGITGNTSGSLTLESPDVVSIGSGGINNAGSGNVTLRAGADGSGILYVNGSIVTGGDLSLSAGTNDLIYLHTAGDLTAGNITFNSNAALYGTTGITRTLNAGTGTLSLRNLSAGDRNLIFIADNMTLNGAVTNDTGRNIDIRTSTANRAINIGGGTGGLDLSDAELAYLQAGGKITIGTEGTGTGTLTATSAAFNNDVALYGGQIYLNGLTSTGSVFARSQGAGNDITLGGIVSSGATGDAITLVSADDFINNRGADALFTSNAGGRWLVYSEQMDQNVRGGLMPGVSEFGVTYPTGPAGAGNRFLYSSTVRPTLDIKVSDDSVVFNEAYNPADFGYTITGGLLAGDTQFNIGLSGDLSYATTYTPNMFLPSATPQPNMLTGTIGTLESVLGYQFNAVQAGSLLVTGVYVPPPVTSLPSTYQVISAAPNSVLGSYHSPYPASGGNLVQGGTASSGGSQSANTSGDDDGESTQGRLALKMTDGYDFSTWGLPLVIDPVIRTQYRLPEGIY